MTEKATEQSRSGTEQTDSGRRYADPGLQRLSEQQRDPARVANRASAQRRPS